MSFDRSYSAAAPMPGPRAVFTRTKSYTETYAE